MRRNAAELTDCRNGIIYEAKLQTRIKSLYQRYIKKGTPASVISAVIRRIAQQKIWSDEFAIKMMFAAHLGYGLDLNNPVSFNEKMQWLKLNDRNPIYTKMADKLAMKSYVEELVGPGYTVPVLSVWNSVDEIDFTTLPKRFVLKTNHDQGGIAICANADSFDQQNARSLLERHLKSKNPYFICREWPYKNIERKVFAEDYLDAGGADLKDYKLFCFSNGRIITLLMTDRFHNRQTTETFFDEDWSVLKLSEGGHPQVREEPKPRHFEEMKRIALALSRDLPFLRVDFYDTEERPFVGELTFYPQGGFERFCPQEWDKKFGSWIDLDRAYGGRPGN